MYMAGDQMPERCRSCGGRIEDYDEYRSCRHCKKPYHKECVPDICIQCSRVMR